MTLDISIERGVEVNPDESTEVAAQVTKLFNSVSDLLKKAGVNNFYLLAAVPASTGDVERLRASREQFKDLAVNEVTTMGLVSGPTPNVFLLAHCMMLEFERIGIEPLGLQLLGGAMNRMLTTAEELGRLAQTPSQDIPLNISDAIH